MSKVQHLLALKDEITYLKTQTGSSGKGHIYTTISTLEHRVKEISEEIESYEKNLTTR